MINVVLQTPSTEHYYTADRDKLKFDRTCYAKNDTRNSNEIKCHKLQQLDFGKNND